MLIAAPTCPDCGSELEQESGGIMAWWCWRDRSAWWLDEDGYLHSLGPGDLVG